MDCIILLLLLSCCGGFGCGGNNRSGGGSGRSSSRSDDCDCNNTSSPRNSNNFGGNYSTVNGNFGRQDNVSQANSDCGCGQDDNIRSVSGQNPSNWQDFPEISRRDNNSNCDCDN